MDDETIQFTRKYSDDEVLIFSGKFADKFTADWFQTYRNSKFESVRNAVAEEVEGVMRGYAATSEMVPLPKDLLHMMTTAANAVVDTALRSA
jgi:hypothetical protein